MFKDLEKLFFSGRTDTGVHACNQSINFYSNILIKPIHIKKYVNKLKHPIKVNQVSFVGSRFNARKSAKKREYQYLFTNEDVPIYLNKFVENVDFKLRMPIINAFLECLVGEHDFSMFKKEGSQSKTSIRTIYNASCEVFNYKVLTDHDKTIIIYNVKIIGNAFLYRMVRNIIGCLFEILNPKSNLNLERFIHNFEKRKKVIYKPANARGLHLNKIYY